MEIGGNNISSFSPEEHHLSIELSSERISYSLLNTNNLEYVYFKSVSATENNSIVNIISSEEVLKQEYSSSSISYKDFPSTLIPNELYKEEEKSPFGTYIVYNEAKNLFKNEKVVLLKDNFYDYLFKNYTDSFPDFGNYICIKNDDLHSILFLLVNQTSLHMILPIVPFLPFPTVPWPWPPAGCSSPVQ